MGFERCHPAINLIYFTAVILGMLLFQHPIYLLICFLCAFLYSVKRCGRKRFIFDIILIPLVAVFALYYSSYNHFGVTVLQKNMIDNNITLESLVYGLVLGFRIAGALIWFSCVFSVFTSDKVVYLFGRISPRLSLFLAILLRMVPRIKAQAKKINTAQYGLGRGANQGHILRRAHNCIRIFSMLVTWTIDSFSVASESMQSRGSTLRGRKAFSIYRFDNRDRTFAVTMVACLTLTLMGVWLRQMDMQYDPRLVFPDITSMSYFFFFSYTAFCLMPVTLELWTEFRFYKARTTL